METSFQGDSKGTVKVVGTNAELSRKVGVEMALFIKGKNVNRAISDLAQVIDQKISLPFKRFNKGIGHKRGNTMAGRYPINASLAIIKLLSSLKKNAENKAMDEDAIKIVHASCYGEAKAWHYGRFRGRRRKLCRFELVGREEEKPKEEKKK